MGIRDRGLFRPNQILAGKYPTLGMQYPGGVTTGERARWRMRASVGAFL